MNKTAIVIGATGLIGKQTTQLLLADDRYAKVRVFVRRTMGIAHPKLDEHIVDYANIQDWQQLIQGDELYSALGTTIKKAGSQARQYEIDYTYQYQAAQAAANNGVARYMLVSSAGANHKSSNFYTRIKGELDEGVKALNFEKVYIYRPSLLVGEREETRMGERIGFLLSKPLMLLPGLRKYRPIEGRTVAQAMIHSANANSTAKISVYELDEIFRLLE